MTTIADQLREVSAMNGDRSGYPWIAGVLEAAAPAEPEPWAFPMYVGDDPSYGEPDPNRVRVEWDFPLWYVSLVADVDAKSFRLLATNWYDVDVLEELTLEPGPEQAAQLRAHAAARDGGSDDKHPQGSAFVGSPAAGATVQMRTLHLEGDLPTG